MGAVFSRTDGYTTLANLIGAFGFHTVCMALGGFFIIKSAQKAPAQVEKTAAAGQV